MCEAGVVVVHDGEDTIPRGPFEIFRPLASASTSPWLQFWIGFQARCFLSAYRGMEDAGPGEGRSIRWIGNSRKQYFWTTSDEVTLWGSTRITKILVVL